MTKTFTCNICNITYESKWSHEEALKEFHENHNKKLHDLPRFVLCDDCHIEIQSWKKTIPDHILKKMEDDFIGQFND